MFFCKNLFSFSLSIFSLLFPSSFQHQLFFDPLKKIQVLRHHAVLWNFRLRPNDGSRPPAAACCNNKEENKKKQQQKK
jgi:hypothetical protein